MRRRIVVGLLLLLPVAMAGLACSFVTVLVVGDGDTAVTWGYALAMVALTLANLWAEHVYRR